MAQLNDLLVLGESNILGKIQILDKLYANGGIIANNIHLTGNTDASKLTGEGVEIQVGPLDGEHILIDRNEIMARKGPSFTNADNKQEWNMSTLHLNLDGGPIKTGAGGIQTSTVTPLTAKTYSLGSSSYYWDSIFGQTIQLYNTADSKGIILARGTDTTNEILKIRTDANNGVIHNVNETKQSIVNLVLEYTDKANSGAGKGSKTIIFKNTSTDGTSITADAFTGRAQSVDVTEGSSNVDRQIVVSAGTTTGQNLYSTPGVTINYKNKTITAAGGFKGNADTATEAAKVAKNLSINGKSFNGSSAVDVGTIGVTYGGTGNNAAYTKNTLIYASATNKLSSLSVSNIDGSQLEMTNSGTSRGAFKASNNNGSVSLLASSNRGLYDEAHETNNNSTGEWIIKVDKDSTKVTIPYWGTIGGTDIPVYIKSGYPTACTKLAVSVGGTGRTSWTTNRMMYVTSAGELTSGYHWVDNTHVAIGRSSAAPSYALYVGAENSADGRLGVAKTITIADKVTLEYVSSTESLDFKFI